MEKLKLLFLLAGFLATSASAQNKVLQIYKDGNVVTSMDISQIDSIKFADKETVIYGETFGTTAVQGTTWPGVADYDGYDRTGSGAAQVTCTAEGGAVSVRTNAASNYPGASGACNAMMAAGGATLLINDIATCGAKTLSLSFGSNQTDAVLAVAYKINGTSQWVKIPYVKSEEGWESVNNLTISLPDGTNTIKLRFTAGTTDYGTRVDDITLTTREAIGAPVIDPDTYNPPQPVEGIYGETFGTTAVQNGTAWPSVTEYAGYSKTGSGAAQVTYSAEGGNITIRTNSASSYPGASGACNVLMAAGGASLVINDIATCGATTLSLSFGSNETDAVLSVAYKINGTTQWVPIPYTKSMPGWEPVSDLTISLPSGTNTIKLKFTAGTTQYGTRVDDILITTEDATGAPVIDPDGGPTPGNNILNVPFTDGSQGGFTTYSVIGDLYWVLQTQYGMMMSGYAGGSSYQNEDWLISPTMNLSGKTNVALTFDHARGPAGSMSVPLTGFTLWISNNYISGAPSTATWTQVSIPTHATTAWGYVSSGSITIPFDKLTANTRFAFEYVCSNAESATWEIKNVVVKETQAP